MRRIASLVVLVVATSVFAQEPGPAPAAPATPAAPPPPADEIKRVLEYQDSGKDRGPALLDLIACLKVDQTNGSATKFTCLEPVTANVKKGTVINAWAQFFCPKDGSYEDLRFKWLIGSEVYETQDFKVSGLARTRTWRAYAPKRAGKWTVKVVRGEGDAAKELGSVSFTVDN